MSEWVPASGVNRSPSAYPVWSVTVWLPASTSFQYSFVRGDGPGNHHIEGGAKRGFTTPASGAVTRHDVFHDRIGGIRLCRGGLGIADGGEVGGSLY